MQAGYKFSGGYTDRHADDEAMQIRCRGLHCGVMLTERCGDDVFLWANPRKLASLTFFVKQDNLHRRTPLVRCLKCERNLR